MKKATLTVTTDLGTFTRTTARTYTHLVIVKGYRADRIEAHRVATIAHNLKLAKQYRKGLDGSGRPCSSVNQEQLNIWADEYQQSALVLEAMAPITDDKASWGLDEVNLTSVPTWGVIGWCGRLDLARKLAAGKEGVERFRDVRIIDVATGAVVWANGGGR